MTFGFLGKVAQDVGHDVSVVAHGNNNPGGGVFGFLKNTAVGTARSAAQTGAGFVNAELTGHPTSGVAQMTLPKQAQSFVGTPNARQLAGSVIQTAALGVGGPAFKAAEKGIEPIVGGLAGKVAAGAASQAPVGAAFNVGSELQGNQKITPMSFLKTAGEGAALGAGLGAAGPVVGAGAKAVGSRYYSALEAQVPRATLHDQQVMKNYTDYLVGANPAKGQELNQLIADARTVGQKHGVDLSANNTVEGRIDAATSILDQIGKNRQAATQGGYVHIPGQNDIHTIETPQGTVRLPQNELEKLVQAKTPQEVKAVIGDSLPENISNKLANAIPQTKDPIVIKNMIANELTPKPTIADIAPPQPPVTQPETNPLAERQRGFIDTIQNSNTSSEQLKEEARKLQQTYEQNPNKELVQQAQDTVNKDYTGSLSHVLSTENLTDKDVAVAQELVRRAQAKGTPEGTQEAINIVDTLDTKLRESGRAVQAASIWSRLSPEGVLKLAAKKIGQARETKRGASKEVPTAQEIKQAVEDSVPPFDRAAVGKAVQEIANGQQKLDLGGLEGGSQAAESTGQKLAKNVEKAASPQVKKKVDTLVAELTKKVKQEYIEPKTPVKKTPLSILQEVFGRSAEAKEAYPLAQKILREKYANVPLMQDALDKFFGSKLDIPAASSTINRAISDQLKTNGEKVSDIIYKSLTTQEATVKNVTNDLVKEGFDKESATQLAEEVAKRLNKQVTNAKQSALERLGAEAPTRAKSTYADKLNKFSNLGALSNEDYLHLARAKLNLPQLTTETAGRIHELSQKLQDLPEGHDKYSAVREIQNLIQDSIPKSKIELAKEFFGLPRTLQATGDLSFGGRQGLAYFTAHPVRFAQGWVKQFEYFKQAFAGKDSEAYDAMMADIRSHPNYHLLESSPAHLLEIGGHDTELRGENYLSSDLAEKIPAIGRLVRASNYAYTGLSNYLRANEFYSQIQHLESADVPLTKELIDGIGEQISTSLGRGGKPGGFIEKHGGFLSTTLFAPRLIASRVNMMNPYYYYRLPAPARQEALRSLLGLSAFAVGTLALAKQAGANVSTDPRNADFGKIREGDTRFDLLGGYSQYLRFGAQLLTGEKINSTTGAQTEAGKGIAGSRKDIALNFIQGKENPTLSFVATVLQGKDISGNSIYNVKGMSGQVAQRFIPLLAQDINDLRTHPDAAGGSPIGKAASAVGGLFGAGLQTYGIQDEPLTAKQTTYIQNLKKQGADTQTVQATTQFFQTLKNISGTRSNVSDAINNALKDKNVEKAQQIADSYNQKLAKGIAPWNQHYGQYANSDLQEAYSKAKINLTPSSIDQREKSLSSTKPF